MIDIKVLNMLKEDVKHDCREQSTRFYSSIKALSEYSIKYFYKLVVGEEYYNANLNELITWLENKYKYAVDYNYFREINRLRNIREHNPERLNARVVGFNRIVELVMMYNDLIRFFTDEAAGFSKDFRNYSVSSQITVYNFRQLELIELHHTC